MLIGTECHTCEVGRYSNPATDSLAIPWALNCTLCAKGKYQPHNGSDHCIDCPTGRYVDEKESTDCIDCPPGKYQDTTGAPDYSYCTVCPYGKYTPDNATTVCTLCPAGKYNQDALGYHAYLHDDVLDCNDCAPGKTSLEDRSTCKDCEEGTYPNHTRQECVPCATGKFSPTGIKCSDCEAGSSTDGVSVAASTCTGCSAGTYSLRLSVNCSDCSAGNWSTTRSSKCTKCNAGEITTEPASASCTACSSGTYQPESGSSFCLNCTAGKFAGATGSTKCDACAYGEYSDLGAASCQDCDPGTYSAEESPRCSDCPKGRWAPSAAETCTPCDSGKFANETASASCTACASGHYAARNESRVCLACAAGTYAASTGTKKCIDCEGGKYSGQASTSCSSCAAGKFSDSGAEKCMNCHVGYFSVNNQAECSPCAEGHFTNENGTSSCTACSAGSYQPRNGSTSCVPCAAGKYSPTTGATVCEDCSAGSYANHTSTGCYKCKAGRYSDEGAPWCTDCATGKYSTTGSSVCEACAAGKYAEETGTDACAKCSAGEYSEQGSAACAECAGGTYSSAGASSCLACSGGKYSRRGSSSCSSCDAGFYSDDVADRCSSCQAGTYSNNGDSECTDCKVGEYSPYPNATDCLDCVTPRTSSVGSYHCDLCEAGYYDAGTKEQVNDDDGDDSTQITCVQCPEGAVCHEEGVTLANMEVEKGYYRFAANSSSVYPCPKPALCLGGNVTGSATCQSGSKGPLCGLCLDNYYYKDDGSDTNCEKCAFEAGAVIATFTIIGSMLVLGLIAICLAERLYDYYLEHENFILDLGEKMTAIFVTMQAIVLLKDNHASVGGSDFEDPYKHFLKWFQWMSFDFIEVLPIECVVGTKTMNFFSKLIFTTLVPILLFVVVRLLGCFCADSKYNNKEYNIQAGKTTSMVQNLNYVGVQALYLMLPLICTTVCWTFRCDSFCYDNPENTEDCAGAEKQWFLAADYSIQCDDYGTWGGYPKKHLLVYGAVMVLIFPIGVPLALFFYLWRLRRKFDPIGLSEEAALTLRLEDEELEKSAVAVLALRHRPRFWWFEVYGMFRRLLLTSFALVFRQKEDLTIWLLGVGIITTVIHREASPELNPFLSAFVYVMHWQITMVVLALILMDSGMTTPAGSRLGSYTLLLTNIAMMFVVFIDTRYNLMRQAREAFLANNFFDQISAGLTHMYAEHSSSSNSFFGTESFRDTRDTSPGIDMKSMGPKRRSSIDVASNDTLREVSLDQKGMDELFFQEDDAGAGMADVDVTVVEDVDLGDEEIDVADVYSTKPELSKKKSSLKSMKDLFSKSFSRSNSGTKNRQLSVASRQSAIVDFSDMYSGGENIAASGSASPSTRNPMAGKSERYSKPAGSPHLGRKARDPKQTKIKKGFDTRGSAGPPPSNPQLSKANSEDHI